ncbi:MAG: GSCFA domain-containing protein [Ignavibacteriales bacterium]|nr:GSCFA domain-containing protein [Ignavibacteriales bacterium]
MDPYKRDLMDRKLVEGEVHPPMEFGSRWFKPKDFKWLPSQSELRKAGLDSIMEGWKPAEPFIRPETKVIALGSCFAKHFVLWLADHGFNKSVPKSPYNAIIRNAFSFESVSVIAQQFRWAFDELGSDKTFWVEKNKEIFEATEERRRLVRETFENIDVLVLTLGLSEVWYDQVTGEPLWRAIPEKYYDPARHVFRVESLSTTIGSLEKIDWLRRQHLPDLKIIFTISPVRLGATFRPVSALTANSASKAVLRAGLDEFLRSRWDDVNKTLFYFPSYEMVTDYFKEPFQEDNRHLYEHIPQQILSVFARYYTAGDLTDPSEPVAVDESGLQELHTTIRQLEVDRTKLQQICDERLHVIEQLDAEYHSMTRAAEERLRLIEMLDAEVNKLKGGA